MRRTIRLLAATLLTVWTLPAAAQHMGQDGSKQMPMKMTESGGMKCMMHGGMMQNMHGMMMSDPLMHSRMLIAVLPTMKEPLSLSDEQVTEFSKIKAEYETRIAELKDQIGDAEGTVEDVLESESPDTSQLRESLRQAAMLKADLKAAGFETAMQMKGSLSEDQRAKLGGLTPMKMHHHMMANMTMMEMMQAMRGGMMMPEMKMREMMHGGQSDSMPHGKMGMMKHGGMMH